jgi:hypothetical protein
MADGTTQGVTSTAPNLDDRLELAISIINDHLFNAGRGSLTPLECQVLQMPQGYTSHVAYLANYCGSDLRHAQQLLDEWHAWHGGL